MDNDYDELETIAARLGSTASASRLQGVLAGALCATTSDTGRVPPGLPTLLGLEEPLAPEDGYELLGAAERVATSLRDPEFAFAPLLPEDHRLLAERAEVLAEWCDAFVEGFSTAMDIEDADEMSAETEEILADLSAIAGGLDPESLNEEDEDDERDFYQIAEFVRIGVISIFAERAATPPESLH